MESLGRRIINMETSTDFQGGMSRMEHGQSSNPGRNDEDWTLTSRLCNWRHRRCLVGQEV